MKTGVYYNAKLNDVFILTTTTLSGDRLYIFVTYSDGRVIFEQITTCCRFEKHITYLGEL